MLSRLVMACVAGIIVFLICILVGGLLASTGVPFITVVGAFLVKFAGLLGLLSALAHFFGGGPTFFNR